ncbi:hypothetical protein [Solidesulfovibrio sp.]|uniref:hypothetical protein n=1 Tax=Solidesulfovibrio sp. TaxID=2910990 RepID=UPI002B20F090|nr:hypothetical protein [Solidesulfovibrio sp.]MEA5090610.1 hypothetical protein [Solidesulfovibrio sp.]
MDSIYQGDTGVELLVDCGRDIAGAVGPVLRVRAPSGAVRVFPGSLVEKDGVTRHIRYVTRAGDLDEAGVYRIQAALTLGDWTGVGRTARLAVRARFS